LDCDTLRPGGTIVLFEAVDKEDDDDDDEGAGEEDLGEWST